MLVKVSILDRDPRILSEMGAKVVFVSRRRRPRRRAAPWVMAPSRPSCGRTARRVWVVENEAVRRVTVDVGETRGDKIEVRQGLTGGEASCCSRPPR